VGTIEAEHAALANAQQSARAVASACSAAATTVTAMGELAGSALPGCDVVAAAWSRFANAASGYVSAFGEAADILGQKVGAAAATYQSTESGVTSSMAGSPT
jgi:hypothetical protein